MHAFDVLGDPVRRRIMDLLADARSAGSAAIAAGDIAATIRDEFGISQPAVSQHLKVLRDNGFATVTADGQRRLYDVDDRALREIDAWLDRYRAFWETQLDALDVEIRRGKRARRTKQEETTP